MNRPQLIKKMTEAGLDLTRIEINGSGCSLEVTIWQDPEDYDSLDRDFDTFKAKVADWGGFGNGYHWTLRANYVDPNPYGLTGTADPIHY